jgi:hypothetical protein
MGFVVSEARRVQCDQRGMEVQHLQPRSQEQRHGHSQVEFRVHPGQERVVLQDDRKPQESRPLNQRHEMWLKKRQWMRSCDQAVVEQLDEDPRVFVERVAPK